MTIAYTTGQITLTNGSPVVTGVGTGWAVSLIAGGIVAAEADGNTLPIETVDSDTQITAAIAWKGATGTYDYALVRDTAYLQQLNMNSATLARLIAELDAGTVFKYDAAGDLAGRATYDDRPKGFSYLVSIGVPNPTLYVKASATSGDWSGPFAYGTGPKGDTGVTGPAGIANPRGTYSGATAYVKNDVVLYNGSSFVALGATTGNAPPTLPTTSNTYWQLTAIKGTDGTGTGDVVGPAGATANALAAFNGSTGKSLKEAPAGSVSNALLANMPTANIKGRLTAGSGAPEDLTGNQVRAIIRGDFLGGFRNKLINGDFDLWQRATSQTTNGYGSDDRWSNEQIGSTKTHSRQAFTLGQTDVPGEPRFFSRTVVASVAGASNFVIKRQKIEGVRSLAGKTATLTFYAKADAAKSIATQLIQQFGSGGSPSANVTVDARKHLLGTGFAKYTFVISIPSMSGKTVGSTGDDTLILLFWFDAGSTYDASTATLGQQSGTFDIAHVSLVEGDATLESDPFSPRHIQQEIALCQRYYQVHDQVLDWYGAVSYTAYTMIFLPTQMRVQPTGSFTTGSTAGSFGGPTIIYQADRVGGYMSSTGASSNTWQGTIKLDAEL